MNTSTMGQFLAALRKANGMTQQEVADRLNVSNKAVSRWERDECAPDITLIPALAEMFGVTCDELLRGERILTEEKQEKAAPRTEKQASALINRTLSEFQTLNILSVALSVIGLICMLGISYGFYRPVIGFAVLLIFVSAAVILALIARNKPKAAAGSDVFDSAPANAQAGFRAKIGSTSFNALFTAIAAVVCALPLMLTLEDGYSVLWFEDYMRMLAFCLMGLMCVYLAGKPALVRSLSCKGRPALTDAEKTRRRLNVLQLGSTVSGALLMGISTYIDTPLEKTPWACGALMLGGLALPAAGIVCFIVLFVRRKAERRTLLIPGVRNILLILPFALAGMSHGAAFSSSDGRYDLWNHTYLRVALISALAILLLGMVAQRVTEKRNMNNKD